MLRTIILSVLLFAFSYSLSAANKYWVGGSYGDWDDATNWSPAAIPTTSDDVFLFCDCNVYINGGYNAVAASVMIYEEAYVSVSSNSSLETVPTAYYGIQVFGRLNNWGTTTVRNPVTNVFQGIIVEEDGRINNWGTLRTNYAETGLRINGDLVSWGDIYVNEAAASGQLNGIVFDGAGRLTNFSNCQIVVNHTNTYGIVTTANTNFYLRGEIIIESGCTSRGIANTGSFSNNGNIHIKGATTAGFYNSGTLYNTGELRFSGSVSGQAINSNGGNITNTSSGRIRVFGSQLNEAISFAGIGYHFYNQGRIDVFTGLSGFDCLYFHWGTEMTNSASGVIDVTTYANSALTFNGTELENNGGLIELNNYGSNKSSLTIGQNCQVTNRNCGTIQLQDKLTMGFDAELVNTAWIEMTTSAAPVMYTNSLISNGGVIHDISGGLEFFDFSHMYNDEGVVITAPTDMINFGAPYTDYIIAGPFTGVAVAEEVTDGGSVQIGQYDENSLAVYFDGNAYNDPKYFHVDVTIPGCGTRNYAVYNNTPAPFTGPGSSPALRLSGNTSTGVQELTVYPNPAIDVLNVNLPTNLEGAVSIELLDIRGRRIQAGSYTAGNGTLRVNRPANLAAGTYLLTVRNGRNDFLETRRVVFGN